MVWSGRTILEIDPEHKNKKIGFHPKSQRKLLMILCVFDDSHTYMQKELLCAPRGRLRRFRLASIAISVPASEIASQFWSMRLSYVFDSANIFIYFICTIYFIYSTYSNHQIYINGSRYQRLPNFPN